MASETNQPASVQSQIAETEDLNTDNMEASTEAARAGGSCFKVLRGFALFLGVAAVIAVFLCAHLELKQHAVLAAQHRQLKAAVKTLKQHLLAWASTMQRKQINQMRREVNDTHNQLNDTILKMKAELEVEDGLLRSMFPDISEEIAYVEDLVRSMRCLPHKNKGYSWQHGTTKCLRLVRQDQNWTSALKTCQDDGGRLAIIEDMVTMDVVRAYLDKMGTSAGNIFVGGQWVNVTEGWRWLDGTPIDEGLWTPGEPSRQEGETCASIWWFKRDETRTLLDDFVCDAPVMFLCEIV